MSPAFEATVKDYYAEKSSYIELLEETVKSQGKTEQKIDAEVTEQVARKQNAHPSEHENQRENSKLVSIPLGLSSDKDGNSVDKTDVATYIQELRRSDERGTDKLSQDRKKVWIEIDQRLGVSSKK